MKSESTLIGGTMDSLNLYLQEITKIPLLTAKEEKMWARLLFKYRQAVRLWSKINANGRLTPWRESFSPLAWARERDKRHKRKIYSG